MFSLPGGGGDTFNITTKLRVLCIIILLVKMYMIGQTVLSIKQLIQENAACAS